MELKESIQNQSPVERLNVYLFLDGTIQKRIAVGCHTPDPLLNLLDLVGETEIAQQTHNSPQQPEKHRRPWGELQHGVDGPIPPKMKTQNPVLITESLLVPMLMKLNLILASSNQELERNIRPKS